MASYETRWSEERSDELVKHWRSGLSATQIGVLMSCTGNSVIGRLSRMGQLARATPQRTQSYAPSREARVRIIKAATLKGERVSGFLPPKPVPKAPDSEPVTMLDLKAHHCRWPIAEPPQSAETMFCGARRVLPGAWCMFHAGIARHGSQYTMGQTLRLERLTGW